MDKWLDEGKEEPVCLTYEYLNLAEPESTVNSLCMAPGIMQRCSNDRPDGGSDSFEASKTPNGEARYMVS